MVQDFANGTTKKAKRNTALMLGFIVIIAGCLALVAYHHNTRKNKKILTEETLLPAIATKKLTTQEPKKLQFDFYSLLSKATVNVGSSNTISSSPLKDDGYFLQAASISNAQAAKQFQEKLGLLGFNAFIKSSQMNNQTWYRVMLGPYKTLSTAQQDQTRLSQQALQSFIIRPQV